MKQILKLHQKKTKMNEERKTNDEPCSKMIRRMIEKIEKQNEGKGCYI